MQKVVFNPDRPEEHQNLIMVFLSKQKWIHNLEIHGIYWNVTEMHQTAKIILPCFCQVPASWASRQGEECAGKFKDFPSISAIPTDTADSAMLTSQGLWGQ